VNFKISRPLMNCVSLACVFTSSSKLLLHIYALRICAKPIMVCILFSFIYFRWSTLSRQSTREPLPLLQSRYATSEHLIFTFYFTSVSTLSYPGKYDDASLFLKNNIGKCFWGERGKEKENGK
jgi:hypothetical protein